MAKKEAEVVKRDEVKEVQTDVFSKAAILAAKSNEYRRDALGAILEDNKEYSVAEVDDLYNNFMKGQVK